MLEWLHSSAPSALAALSGMSALGHHLVGSTLRGAALLLLVMAVVVLCARRSASLRHLLWALCLGQLGLLTAAGWLLPAWRWQALPADPFPLVAFAGGGVARAALDAGGPAVASAAAGVPALVASAVASGPADPGAGAGWPLLILLLGWAAGALWLLARTARGVWDARQLARRSTPVSDPALRDAVGRVSRRLGLSMPVDLRFGAGIDTPLATGLFQPAVLLPAGAATWSVDLLESVLTHELAHVRRRDCAVQLMAQVVRAIHWMNPLCWLAVHRLTVERERACDDLVLETGTRPSRYATHLLEVARQASGLRPTPAAMAMFMFRGLALAERLERMLDGHRSHRVIGRRAVGALAAAALLMTLPVACLVGEPAKRGPGVRLTYKADPASAERTAEVLGRRLDLLDLAGARVERQGALLVVDLPAGPSALVVDGWKQTLQRPGNLRLAIVDRHSGYPERLARAVAADPQARAAGITAETEVERRGDQTYQDHFVRGPRPALEHYLAQLPPALTPEPGHRLVLETGEVEPQVVRTFYLDERRQFTITRFADAQIQMRDDLPDGFFVFIRLDPADGEALKKLTAAHVGERMAVMLDNQEMWGAPTIQSPFGERLSVSAKGTKAEAERLAESFRIGALPAPLTLVSEEVLGR